MRRTIPAVVAFFGIHLAVVVGLMNAAKRLPPNVASHFNAAGVADGWMPRDSYLWGMGLTVFGVSALMLAAFYGIRFIPAQTINIRDRDYWLDDEHRADTYAYLFHAGVWLAAFQAALLLGVHQLVVAANFAQPVKLSSNVWILVGAFLAAVILWLVVLVRRFNRPAPVPA